VELRLLGTTEVVVEGDKQALGGPMVRAVLADLALNAGQALARSRLVDDLWGQSPPASAVHTVQAYVSRLRLVLNAGGEKAVLLTSGPAYVLDVSPSEVDALRFLSLASEGRAALSARDPATAEAKLSAGLSLWRGQALVDVQEANFAPSASVRLEGERLLAIETLFDARLQLGHHRELVSPLQAAIAADPFREHLHAQLMTALYRSGRQADSLAAFKRARDLLVNELGVEPGRELREVERAVLTQAPELELRPDLGHERAVSRAPQAPSPAQAIVEGPLSKPTIVPGSGSEAPRRGWAFKLVGTGAVVALVGAAAVTKLANPAGAHAVALGVSELSASSGRIVGSLSLTGEPGGAASGDGSVWVTSPVSGTLYRIDPASAAVEATVVIGTGAGAIAVAGPNVWVANTVSGTLSQVSAGTDQVVQTLPLGPEPTGIAVGDGSLWVANAFASSLTEVDIATDAVTTYQLAEQPGRRERHPLLTPRWPDCPDPGRRWSHRGDLRPRYGMGSERDRQHGLSHQPRYRRCSCHHPGQ
jgi:DNA-binding SARP family transcriptional activator